MYIAFNFQKIIFIIVKDLHIQYPCFGNIYHLYIYIYIYIYFLYIYIYASSNNALVSSLHSTERQITFNHQVLSFPVTHVVVIRKMKS